MTHLARSSTLRCVIILFLLSIAMAPTAGAPGSVGIDVAGMDKGVAPGDDFFAYANGGWLKSAVIPPDRQSAALHNEINAVFKDLPAIGCSGTSRRSATVSSASRAMTSSRWE